MADVRYREFRGLFRRSRTLFAEAAAFASELGDDKLISITHACHGAQHLVTVWYRR
ncbi:MAG: hypothetical protein AB8H80_15425 [Planctomycetota bacterium]